jgi:hypothetical protein
MCRTAAGFALPGVLLVLLEACSSTDASGPPAVLTDAAPDAYGDDSAVAEAGGSGGSNTGADASSADADADDVAPEVAQPDGEGGDDTGVPPFDAGPDPCGEVNAFVPMFADVVARWSAQDDIGGWPDSPLVVTGSSSIRRWETLALSYTDYDPIQRGMGGAQLGEIAYYAEQLVTRHDPRAVVVYAGTNDIHAGVAPDVVVGRLRCLRYRIGSKLGWTRPVLFVALTPNPSRWAEWPASAQVNAAVAALAEADPGLVYVDVATAFLATGSPPDASLFVSDGLHLSHDGYALWNSVIRPAVEAAAAPTPQPATPVPALASGTRILVDLGPSNPEDGEWTPSPDYLGQDWNNWHALEGGVDVLPGEQIVDLVASDGTATGIDLVIAGGFQANGRSNGGLLWPDPALLGDLAVGSATGDFFYAAGDDVPGALFLRGLDPNHTYTLRLFAARDDTEVRVTRYTVQGAHTASATLQTSGPGAGKGGKTTNDDDIVTFAGVRPDPWGHLFLDVSIEQGSYAYLSLLEISVD